jgi:hypothetical protein
MKRFLTVAVSILVLVSCGEVDVESWQRVNLPEGYSDSHILSIDVRDNSILLGTYGRGALFSRDDGANWTVYDTSNGLSWNFIFGGDWQDNYLILATLGDGLNISGDNGKTWDRYGYNFFGIEYLYTVGAKIHNGKKLVPTADGLVVFDSIADWHAITEKEGIASQYIYDMKVAGDTIALGSLHGYSISYDGGSTWANFSPNGKFTQNRLPACRVRAVQFKDLSLFAGCDDGLYVSTDGGKSWKLRGAERLTSLFVHDLMIDDDNNLWLATYKEIASLNLESDEWVLFGLESGLPHGSVICLGISGKGDLLAGTHHGLFRLTRGRPVPAAAPPVDAVFSETEDPLHQWMLRPVGPDDQNQKDQTYLYGSTMGGNFRQHQGNEYNNPEGVPLLAVDDGVIVYIDREIGHSVLRCDRRQDDFYVYAHYHHQHEIFKQVGDRVRRGDIIGSIGKKGNVTNEHLHFEVSLSLINDSNKESHTRNSELWIEPLPGTGTIAGVLTDSDGNLVPGARIYGVTKPIPTESPFSFAETYMDSVHSDESYNENFAIGDVPEGEYTLHANVDGKSSSVEVMVEAGKVTRARMQLR